MKIPNEAVEAAARAKWERDANRDGYGWATWEDATANQRWLYRDDATATLEAAAAVARIAAKEEA